MEGTGAEEGKGMQLPYQLFVPGPDTTMAIVVSLPPRLAPLEGAAPGCPMTPIHQ